MILFAVTMNWILCECVAKSQSQRKGRQAKYWASFECSNWVCLDVNGLKWEYEYNENEKGTNHYLNTWANNKRRARSSYNIRFDSSAHQRHRQWHTKCSRASCSRRSIEFYMAQYQHTPFSIHGKYILVYAYTSFLYVWYVMRLS